MLRRIFGPKYKIKEDEESKLAKELKKRAEQEVQSGLSIMVEEVAQKAQMPVQTALAHPLLTIQEKITQLEEMYKGIDDKLVLLDGKVATKRDVSDIKGLFREDLEKEDRILEGVASLHGKLKFLDTRRRDLIRQVDKTTRQLTRQQDELTKVDEARSLLNIDQKMLNLLETKDYSTIELGKELGLSRQYLWQRLKSLEDAGHVRSVKKGRKTQYSLIT